MFYLVSHTPHIIEIDYISCFDKYLTERITR